MKFKLYFLVFFSLIVSICLEARETEKPKIFSRREEDLNVILEQNFLREDRFDKIAAMYTAQAIDKSQKNLPLEPIVSCLRQSIQTNEIRQQLMQPYNVFSDEEIHQLRQIFETEAFIKYMELSLPIIKANMQVIDDLLDSIIQQSVEVSEVKSQDHTQIDNEYSQEDWNIIEVTKDNFHEEIEEAKKPAIIDVYAAWCRPCRHFAPIFETLHEKYKGKCRFGQINSDEETLLVNFLKVKAYPTTVLMYKGKVISRLVGYMPKEELEAKIQDFLQEIEENMN
jgi:thioredoxin 1